MDETSACWHPVCCVYILVLCFNVFLQFTRKHSTDGTNWLKKGSFIARRRAHCNSTNLVWQPLIATINYVCLLWLDSTWIFRLLFDVDLKYGLVPRKVPLIPTKMYFRCITCMFFFRSPAKAPRTKGHLGSPKWLISNATYMSLNDLLSCASSVCFENRRGRRRQKQRHKSAIRCGNL